MTPEALDEALTVAMEGVRELGASITLIPSELGLSDEESFSEEDLPLLLSFLGEHFGHDRHFDPGGEIVFLQKNDGVFLHIETNAAGDIVYFFAPIQM